MSTILKLMQQDFNHTSNKYTKYVLQSIISQLKLKDLSNNEDIKIFTLSLCDQKIEDIQNYFKNKKLSIIERKSYLLTDRSTLLLSQETFGVNIKKHEDSIIVIKEYKSIEDKYFSNNDNDEEQDDESKEEESDDDDNDNDDDNLSDTISSIVKKALDFID